MRVEAEFGVPSQATLRFYDAGFALLDGGTAKVGLAVKIAAVDGGDGSETPLFSGEVTSIASSVVSGAPPELTVVAHDRSHRMGRASTVQTFLKMKVSDIVTQLATNVSLKADVTDTKTVGDYLLQVDSDLGLLNELARRVGFDWWVDDATLHFKKPASGPTTTLRLHDDLTDFSVRATGHAPDSVKVSGWDRAQKLPIVGTSRSFNPAVSSDALLIASARSDATSFGSAVRQSSMLVPQTQDEANALSQALFERAVSAAVSVRGTCVDETRIALGRSVTIQDAGRSLSGTYPVTKVEYLFRSGQPLTTRFTGGDRMSRSLVETLGVAGVNRTPAHQHSGLVIGIVTNIKDAEKMGRVKVKLPSVSGDNESWWARVVTAGGGSNRGNTFHPEVDDEVLVGFEGGDPRLPVVIGGLYSDEVADPRARDRRPGAVWRNGR